MADYCEWSKPTAEDRILHSVGIYKCPHDGSIWHRDFSKKPYCEWCGKKIRFVGKDAREV